jgi:hypothetical protein
MKNQDDVYGLVLVAFVIVMLSLHQACQTFNPLPYFHGPRRYALKLQVTVLQSKATKPCSYNHISEARLWTQLIIHICAGAQHSSIEQILPI